MVIPSYYSMDHKGLCKGWLQPCILVHHSRKPTWNVILQNPIYATEMIEYMVQGCAHENYEYIHKHATNDT